MSLGSARWCAAFVWASIAACSCGPTDPELESADSRTRSSRANSRGGELHAVVLEGLDNGGFELAGKTVDSKGVRRVPWWRTASGSVQLEEWSGNVSEIVRADPNTPRALPPPPWRVLRTARGEWAEQPIAAPIDDASKLGPAAPFLRGLVLGAGRLTLVDGSGEPIVIDLAQRWPRTELWQEFVLTRADLEAVLGRKATPRFVLRLEPAPGAEAARWAWLSATTTVAGVSEPHLRAEILEELRFVFATILERSIDDLGPRATAFLCKDFDSVTGERIPSRARVEAGFASPYGQLLELSAVIDVPEWNTALTRFLKDFLELGLHPVTGMPRLWDPEADAPLDDKPVEIALAFGFLIDVADHGPRAFREHARAAAARIGTCVLAQGCLADGTMAASYVPSNGEPNMNVNHLRALDVPCQMARLTQLTGDERFVRAAREALATHEYTWHWAGTWDQIDPAFDDSFGHFGSRAVTIARALPGEAAYARFARDGWRHFQPIWLDALRLGGNVAADQVRCWELFSDLARVDASLATEIGIALHEAARAHWKGEQYGNGAWGDVTLFEFDPKFTQTGDFTGSPQNLLSGLASLYSPHLGLATPEIRALYAEVLRSSVRTYKRPYGFLLDRQERRGQNTAAGSQRMLLGLTRMFVRLSVPH